MSKNLKERTEWDVCFEDLEQRLAKALDEAFEKNEDTILFDIYNLNLNQYEGKGEEIWESALSHYCKARGTKVTWDYVDGEVRASSPTFKFTVRLYLKD